MTASQPPAAQWKLGFFGLWTGQALSLFGSALVQFALIWWLTSTTGSAVVLATATLAGVLPNVLLSPLSGVLVDRFSRRLVMLTADSLVALTTVALAYLFATGAAQVWHVYVALCLRAIAGTFQFPAMQATTALMVPKEQLARIAGFNQMLNGGMNIIAPPIGALLLEVLPLQGVLAVDVATAVLGMLPLLLLRIPEPPRSAAAEGSGTARPSMRRDLVEGLRYVASWPGLVILLAMFAVINLLFAPASALMPLLVTEHFRGGALQLATLESASGIGIVLGGVVLGVWGGFRRRVQTALVGLMGLGLGFTIIGLTPATAFWLAVAAIFGAMFMVAMVNGPLIAVLQTAVAPEMQGRVFSVIGSVSSAMSPLSLVLAGPLAHVIGIRGWYVIAGVICAAIGGLCFFIPAVLGFEDHGAVSATMPPAVSAAEAGG